MIQFSSSHVHMSYMYMHICVIDIYTYIRHICDIRVVKTIQRSCSHVHVYNIHVMTQRLCSHKPMTCVMCTWEMRITHDTCHRCVMCTCVMSCVIHVHTCDMRTCDTSHIYACTHNTSMTCDMCNTHINCTSHRLRTHHVKLCV